MRKKQQEATPDFSVERIEKLCRLGRYRIVNLKTESAKRLNGVRQVRMLDALAERIK